MQALIRYNLNKIKALGMICIRKIKIIGLFIFTSKLLKFLSKMSIERNLFKKLKENNYGKIQL